MNTAADPIVHVEDVAQRFGSRTIFHGVTFDVSAGEVFVILGGSGCGKSSLMKLMIGLRPPSAGKILVNGIDLADEDRRATVLRRIGVMFQSGALFGSMTLLENVMLPLEVHTDLPREARQAVAQIKLGLVGLADAGAKLPAEISGGMAKRAAIARAMALDPTLLFLDEPSAGLDPSSSAGVDALLRDLRDTLGSTIVVVTHELQSILAIADRCVMLDKAAHGPNAGGVIATGDPKALRDDSDNPVVRAFFRREVLPETEGATA